MNTPPSEPAPSAAHHAAQDLRGTLNRHLLASSTGTLWALPVAVILICSILRHSLPPPILGTWTLAALAHGLLVYLKYGRGASNSNLANGQSWHKAHFAALGLVWGGLPLLNALWGTAGGVWLSLVANMGTMAILTFLLGTSERHFLVAFVPLAALTALGIALSDLPRPPVLLLFLLYAWLMWRMHKLFHAVHRERIQASLRNLEQAAALSRSLELRDSLTGLLNKAGLRHWLDSEQSHYLADRPVLFTFGSVLGFGEINSLYGSSTADRVLVALAKRMTNEADGRFAVARIGGADFLLADLRADATPETHAELFTLLEHDPVSIGERMLTIGIQQTWVRGPATELDQLVEVAQDRLHAHYKARFDEHSEIRQQLEQRSLLLQSFDKGLRNGDIQAWFQPIVSCRKDQIIGWEALTRWVHPQLGVVPPVRFLDIARISRQSSQLTRMMLHGAARLVQELTNQGLHQCARVSVNFSASELREPTIADWVAATLEDAGVAPQQIVIEMSEKEALVIDEQFALNLYALKRLGLAIAIDDFGTGFANLGHLLDLPASTLKVDKRFVERLPEDRDSTALIKGILTIANGLGMKTIAEGVERPEQLQLLSELGCDAYQGYLAGVAIPLRAAVDLAARWANG